MYFENEGNRASRKGKWKLVSEAWFWPHLLDAINKLAIEKRELYNMETDRTETKDVAAENIELVKELASEWQRWTERNGAVSKPQKSA